MTDLPDVLVLEWVNHRCGCVSPLDLISRWCRENDILLVVDAVQALGAVPLVFDTDRIDFMAGAAHKWLGGPEGIVFLYSAPEHIHTLNPILPGYASLKTSGQSNQSPMFHGNGRILETGTLSSISLVGFAAAMAELQEFGYHQRLLKIGYLHQRIIEVLRQYPAIQLMEEPLSDGPSGIISFVVLGIDTDVLVNQLAVCGVTAKNRDGVVRLSPSHDIDGDALTARLTLALDQFFAAERPAYV
jgi:selenocysteine lyase/cysteine desulfurase